MVSHIPFVNSQKDCDIFKKYYFDSDVIRINLESIENLRNDLPQHKKLWLDPAIDSYDHILTKKWPVKILELTPQEIVKSWPSDGSGKKIETMKFRTWQNWNKIFRSYKGHKLLAKKEFWRKKHFEELNVFVKEVLNKCLVYNPSWISVPQLPIVDSKERNKINVQLAQATNEWKLLTGFKGNLILPLIFSHQRQLNRKPIRDEKLAQAVKCFDISGARGLWIVDSTLLDQSRNASHMERYSKLIEFHCQIKTAFQERAFIVAGPYWGINIVLWAKGLCDFPAMSLGSSYYYNFSCGARNIGKIRVAIPSLRRWAVTNGLKSWLRDCLRMLNPSEQAYKEFEYLVNNFEAITNRQGASFQIAQFQKQWFEKIRKIPEAGRALGLYQDLSAAFVLGKQLPPLPESALPNSPIAIREAGKVAEQLMLKCL